MMVAQNQEAASILPSKQSSINYNQQFIKSPRRGKEVFFNTLQSDGKKQMLEEVGGSSYFHYLWSIKKINQILLMSFEKSFEWLRKNTSIKYFALPSSLC